MDTDVLLLPGEVDLPAAMLLVREVYAAADAAADRFAAESGVRCPQGCGRCCLGPSPAITRPEAEYLARSAIGAGVAGIAAAVLRAEVSQSPCPFYDPEDDLHCTVYHGRPLVCRTFGFTGSRDRDGRIGYRLCRHMEPPLPFVGRGMPLPTDVHALRLQMPLDPDGLHPLDLAVGSALRSLLLRRQLLAAERFGRARGASARCLADERRGLSRSETHVDALIDQDGIALEGEAEG